MARSSQQVPAHKWLDLLGSEYLQSYIPAGGGAVKIIAIEPSSKEQFLHELCNKAKSFGVYVSVVDVTKCKPHLLHELVAGVLSTLQIETISAAFMKRQLSADGRKMPADGSLRIVDIARENGEDPTPVLQDLRRLLSSRVFRNYSLSREFRSLALALCRATFDDSDDVQNTALAAQDWLQGRLDRVSRLKSLGIYRKLVRSNARQILSSTCEWLYDASPSGLMIVVDISEYMNVKGAPTVLRHFSRSSAIDMNETLRQFIDGATELRGTIICFVTTPTSEVFSSDEPRSRIDLVRSTRCYGSKAMMSSALSHIA